MKPRLKQIIFMRHGIAVERHEFDGPDDQRPLTDKGIKKVKMVATGLAEMFHPELIVTSDLLRARETAEICTKILSSGKAKMPLRILTGLENVLRPESATDGWMKLLPSFEGCETLLVVGHEPNLSALVSRMTVGNGRIDKFKKAGVALMDRIADDGSWSLRVYRSPRDWE